MNIEFLFSDMVISNADKSNYAHKFVANSTQIPSDKQTNKHTRTHAHTHTHAHSSTYAVSLYAILVLRNFKIAKKLNNNRFNLSANV